jgi:hypothetical protein
MTIARLEVLAALDPRRLAAIVQRLAAERPRGRPWSRSLRQRVLLTCIALRTNLTFRELAAVCGTTKSTAHRIVAALVPRLAALARAVRHDRRWSWVVDGTLIPTRDHARAAKSKNYRWSCNAQVLVRRIDLRVVATAAGGAGNRNDPIHYRGSVVELLCKSHGRVLADGGYRGVTELVMPRFRANRILRDAWGDAIGAAGLAPSTQSRDSRTGAFYATIVAAENTSSSRFKRSHSSTTCRSTYGTSLRRRERGLDRLTRAVEDAGLFR